MCCRSPGRLVSEPSAECVLGQCGVAWSGTIAASGRLTAMQRPLDRKAPVESLGLSPVGVLCRSGVVRARHAVLQGADVGAVRAWRNVVADRGKSGLLTPRGPAASPTSSTSADQHRHWSARHRLVVGKPAASLYMTYATLVDGSLAGPPDAYTASPGLLDQPAAHWRLQCTQCR